MEKRKLIIGCGYLGRRVARRWKKQGHQVFALTRSGDHAADFRDAGIEPFIGDVTDSASLASLPEVDTLLYAVGLDRTSGQSQREVYVGGLENVLARMADRVRCFLYISSTSVYGQNAGEWVDESSECRPTSENGSVCLDAESLLRNEASQANVLRTRLRPRRRRIFRIFKVVFVSPTALSRMVGMTTRSRTPSNGSR